MDECGVGIIGLGGFGQLIAAALEGAPGLKLTAVAERMPERRAQGAVQLPKVRLYERAEDLICDEGVELIIIATPPYTHAALARQVLESGKHLYLEKPGALTPEEMSELRHLASSRGLKASIDFVMRRNPLYFLLKDLQVQGLFGEPERAYLENYAHDDQLPPEHWFWDYSKSGGIWIEHGVHFIDVGHWILGPANWVWGASFVRPGRELVERVTGTISYLASTVVNHYHGFTKPELFEDTSFGLVWERAYAVLKGWIPTELRLDALVTPEGEEYLTGKALQRARQYLPGIGVEVKMEKTVLSGMAGVVQGREKVYPVTHRLRLTYILTQDRWTVYRACVRQGILDLASAVTHPAREPSVTLAEAEAALKVASALTQSAATGQVVAMN
ncbi:MAG: Gfo/Idh/MocA family protein [bacterium]